MKDSELIEKAKGALEEFLQLLKITAETKVVIEAGDNDEKIIAVAIVGDNLGNLIGYHGKTLEAIQFIFTQIVNKALDEPVRVLLDINDYRSRRKEYIENVARKALDEARESGQNIELPPMNPFERRIVHMVVKEEKDVYTESTGEGEARRVTLKLKEKAD